MEDIVVRKFTGLREFYQSGSTKNVDYRIRTLKKLKELILANEKEITDALYKDLRKSYQESYVTEIAIVLEEIKVALKNLRKWARPTKVKTPVAFFPSKSRIISEPKGVVFILAPWNYPFQLALAPLVGAIAAGNCVVLKPSTTSKHTCAIIKKIISEAFAENYVTVFDGDHEQTARLLDCRFDHIFFTGGAIFGRTVMEKAAKNLIPVTLELGGKSPCVVDKDANIKIAARRIMWGKLLNAGQTCIAPDYILIHPDIKEEFLQEAVAVIKTFYGENPKESSLYPRIISDKAFARLNEYLGNSGRIVYGGDTDPSDRYISPTIVEDVPENASILKDEIFGPILPLITFDNLSKATEYINNREKPLALYYFGKKEEGLRLLVLISSGGACINDTVIHVGNPKLPFGGIGASGIGKYHGKYSFDTFSNSRSVVISKRKFDIALRYPPYKRFSLIKKIM